MDGLFTVMVPYITIDTFGIKRGTQVYGAMQIHTSLEAIAIIFMIRTVQHTFGYRGFFITCFFMHIVAMLSTFSLVCQKNYKFNYADYYYKQRRVEMAREERNDIEML